MNDNNIENQNSISTEPITENIQNNVPTIDSKEERRKLIRKYSKFMMIGFIIMFIFGVISIFTNHAFLYMRIAVIIGIIYTSVIMFAMVDASFKTKVIKPEVKKTLVLEKLFAIFIIGVTVYCVAKPLFKDIKSTENSVSNTNSVESYNSSNSVIHNNKICYFRQSTSSKSVDLYVRDPISNEKREQCKGFDNGYINGDHIRYINEDELYYSIGSQFKKVNINTCKVTELGNVFEIRINPKIHVVGDYYYNDYNDQELTYVKKIDIKTNEVVKENSVNSILHSDYMVDYDNLDIYSYSYSNSKEPFIRKNNEIIYNLPFDTLLDVNEKYILISKKEDYKYCLYKINTGGKKITEESVMCSLSSFFEIKRDDNKRYIVSRPYIYEYDAESNKLKQLVNLAGITSGVSDEAYLINNKLIFILKQVNNNTNYTDIDYDILVYDINTQTQKGYKYVSLYNIDNDKLAIYTSDRIINIE